VIAGARWRMSFDAGLKRVRFASVPDGTKLPEPPGLEKLGLGEDGWRELTMPHDWGIAGPFRDNPPNQNGKLPWLGISWCRKTFG